MDEQEKEIEEILRTFDKAPSPSSENSVQNQAQQNNKQPRQISQKPTDTERTARTSKSKVKRGALYEKWRTKHRMNEQTTDDNAQMSDIMGGRRNR